MDAITGMFSEETRNLIVKPATTVVIGGLNSKFVENNSWKGAAIDGGLVGGAGFVGDIAQQYSSPDMDLIGVVAGGALYGIVRPLLGSSKGHLVEGIRGMTMIGAGTGWAGAVGDGFGAFD